MAQNKTCSNAHEKCICRNALFTIISGSFRKHLREIIILKKILESKEIIVLSPDGEAAVNPDEEFIVLDSDPVGSPRLLQDSVFAKMRRSTFIVVANVDGYLGRAAVLEIGYAIAQGIAVYTLENVEDPNLAPYCTPISSIFPDLPDLFRQLMKPQLSITEMLAKLRDIKHA